MGHIHPGALPGRKRERSAAFAAACVQLETVTLSAEGQAENDKYPVPLTRGI